MTIDLWLGLFATSLVTLLLLQSWWSLPQTQFAPEICEVGVLDGAPPLPRRDVLDEFERELAFEAITAEGAAEHRLALLEALLHEADQETLRLELLVDKLGNRLLTPA